MIVVVSPTDKIILEKKREPVESDKSRLKKVQELKIADKVILGESGNSYNLLEQVKPDIIALGYDQKIPETLKNQLKKYKIITLKPFKSNKYKSSLLKVAEGPII